MSKPNASGAVLAFNKVLNQPKLQRTNRTPTDITESIRKLRRLILVEGIPSDRVSRLIVLLLHAALKLSLMGSGQLGTHIETESMENPASRERGVRRGVCGLCRPWGMCREG